MFSSGGVWFHTTEEALREFAAPVLERYPLSGLIREAESWLRGSETATLWLVPLLLWLLPPIPASLAALTVYVAWRLLSPSFVNGVVGAALDRLEQVGLQAALYLVTMSLFAMNGSFAALWSGLAWFVALRWGAVAWITEPLLRRLWPTLYRIPAPDVVLRALIIRAAMKYNVPLPEISRMEAKIRAGMYSRKQ